LGRYVGFGLADRPLGIRLSVPGMG
jgi:hypothetical protein